MNMIITRKLQSLSLLIFYTFSLLSEQSPNAIIFDNKGPLMAHTAIPNMQVPKELPLISYQIGNREYSTTVASEIIDISFSAEPFDYGVKGKIRFRNSSNDTINLHNIVPLGRNEEHVYITGKGSHGLSRSHLFRQGYQPINIILPDNSWELGFTCAETDGENNIVALVRRDNKSLKDGMLRRFETTLYPSGAIEYNFWLDKYQGNWQNGMRLIFQERYLYDVPVGGFNNLLMEREDLKWIQSCYSANLMMTWDKRYYDFTDGQFHIKEHLEKMKKLIGGYDLYGIWPTWPALGMDQRNQWDMFRDLPGGFNKLKEISELCHQMGSYFFLCYNPWDESTRSDEGHFDGLTNITRIANIDGFVLDTRGGSSIELQDAADAARDGVVMYSEGMAVPRDMQGIVSGRVHNALYYPPILNLNKFIKPEFAIFRVAEEAHEPIRREFNLSFFNGYGTEINSFPAGRFEWSDDQMRYWGRLLQIQRENSGNFLQSSYTPLLPTLVDSIFVNEWPGESKTIYTIFNLHSGGFRGNLFELNETDDNNHYVDLFHHEELQIDIVGDKKYMPVKLDGFNSFDLGTNNEGSVSAIAAFSKLLSVELSMGDALVFSSKNGDSIRIWAGNPSYEKSPAVFGIEEQSVKLLSVFPNHEGKFVIQVLENDELIDERIVNIKPGTARLISEPEITPRTSKAPEGMVLIPSGIFKCDNYRTGDNFINYPESPTVEGEEVVMSKFFMDKYPVTNKQYKDFLVASGYKPNDTTNFLKHWTNGRIPKGMENYPVIYVTLEDAKAYARWNGKRLPSEIEWQYAAQTEDGNEWPWIQDTPVEREEEFITSTLSVWKIKGIESTRCNLGDGSLYPVGKYKEGVNPYGLYDLVGSVWQLTNDQYDNTTYKYIMVKGGSYFLPTSSFWYVQGGPRELNFRQYLLRVSPSFERKATVGFRCVKDTL